MQEASWQVAQDPSGSETMEFIVPLQDQRMVTGAVWEPHAGYESDALITFGHGASGDRYQEPIPYLARQFAEAGYFSLSMDGPVHGLRQVGPGGREALGKEMRKGKIFDDMVQDWQIAIRIVSKKANLNVERFAYFGLSMGSIFGIPLLASRFRAHEPVTVATLGLLGVTGAVQRFAARLLDDAGVVTCPVLFLMQLEDELFPRDGYLTLFDQLASENKRIHANPGLHPEIPSHEIRFAREFMSKSLVEQKVIHDPVLESR